MSHLRLCSFFFFNDTATTEIYTLSLHDALPIWPCTGGGGNITMKASGILANSWLSCPAIAPPESCGCFRSSNDLSTAKAMPELELLVKPLIDRPGNDTT